MLPLLRATDHPMQAEEFQLRRVALGRQIIIIAAGEIRNKVSRRILPGILLVVHGKTAVITGRLMWIVITGVLETIHIITRPEAVLLTAEEQHVVAPLPVLVQTAGQEAETNQNISVV